MTEASDVTLSPIDIELIWNSLSSITDETYAAVMKAAYSTNIKERRDHSTAIFDARGRIVVQGMSLPLHLTSILGLVEIIMDRYDVAEIRPGDMFVSNDPFVGRGSHLPDVAIVAPVFHKGEVVLYVGNIAHHSDIGGMAPGSMAGGMTEIFQEGLRIPPIRLMREGKIVQDLLDIILLNVRVPRERRGDYMAQISANLLGVRRCLDVVERWSAPVIAEACEEIVAAVARRMRAGIADLPDGEYHFKDVMDDDGVGTESIPLVVRIVVSGDDVLVDFTGSAPQVKGNINLSIAGLQAGVLYALKVLIDPDGPTNHGIIEPIRIVAPEGTITNAVFPAATAARAQTCQRIVDLIHGALASALPERIVAAANGANTMASFSGVGPDGEYYVYLETIGGGFGARSYKDGTDGVQVHITNTSNLPVEALEREYPLLIERYALVPDSGGAGKWRGGLGIVREYRPIGHTVTFSGQGERFVSRPWGLFDGEFGAPGRFELVRADGGREKLAIKPSAVEVTPDDLLVVVTPGAGGYGAPGERDPALVKAEFASGKFSEEYVRDHYPGVLDPS
jgi:N-methylhydantoinase B